ncbi:MAG: response regulator, partial [Deltaproteobacteria bacterium]|nr:response regulator [Deltaproteobacteria bacterium]
PEMSGMETLHRLRREHPEVGVIMISGEFASDADVVIQALEQGALDFLSKAPMNSEGNSVLALRKHLVTLFHQFQGRKNLNLAKRISSWRAFRPRRPEGFQAAAASPAHGEERTGATPRSAGSKPASRRVEPGRIDVVIIGTSTGGPNALSEVIPRLPGDLDVPVLVVQHMPSFLTFSLAQSLNTKSALRVREAMEGEPLRAGTVYVAPGGKHLQVKSRAADRGMSHERYLRLGDGPPENSVRPSVDVLFRSVAESFEGHILAVIMTGMGIDGLKGVQALKPAGCYCITQTAETCVVYGMPRAVDEAGLSDESADLDTLAERIAALVKGSSARRNS